MIDWWLVFQVSAVIWAFGFAVDWLLTTLALIGFFDLFSPAELERTAEEMRLIREFARKNQVRLTFEALFWPIAIPWRIIRKIRRRNRRRKQAASLFGWDRKS